ncbi:hypothetical protein CYB_0351 [Synechococcus sp. JA-2-3B'a(2-13)]|nr:hypothetical protein CYB_0351 [Synechococcus sp. JA-2-3B'a(2-13)]
MQEQVEELQLQHRETLEKKTPPNRSFWDLPALQKS